MSSLTTMLQIRKPDDWHLHLRDGEMMEAVLPFTTQHFARAIIMPNLKQPVTDGASADAYKQRILKALRQQDESCRQQSRFEPLMTAYLTDHTNAAGLIGAFRGGSVVAAKLYPAHATTNAAHGVSDVFGILHVLEAMAEAGMPLLVHAEVTDPAVDVFDREAVFIDRVLAPLTNRLPQLKVVVEHVTTKQGVAFVEASAAHVAATLTPQHLLLNRNAIFLGGIRPHYYCLPVLKRETHREALRKAATSGSAKFFLGTDSAPHSRLLKESSCGCAGMFNAPSAIATYAQVFEEEGALAHLEAFASLNGPAFYGLPPNEQIITLHKEETLVPAVVRLPNGAEVIPFRAGENVGWRVQESGPS